MFDPNKISLFLIVLEKLSKGKNLYWTKLYDFKCDYTYYS